MLNNDGGLCFAAENSINFVAAVPVMRSMGLFGAVSVEWICLNDTQDVTPLRGVVVAEPGEELVYVLLNITQDKVLVKISVQVVMAAFVVQSFRLLVKPIICNKTVKNGKPISV